MGYIMTQDEYTRQLEGEIVEDELGNPLVSWENVPQAGNMEATDIAPGVPVVITDAYGAQIRTIALSGVETAGHSFPVVWVERPLNGGGSERAPWPLEAVKAA
jgi:hypothetical protein